MLVSLLSYSHKGLCSLHLPAVVSTMVILCQDTEIVLEDGSPSKGGGAIDGAVVSETVVPGVVSLPQQTTLVIPPIPNLEMGGQTGGASVAPLHTGWVAIPHRLACQTNVVVAAATYV